MADTPGHLLDEPVTLKGKRTRSRIVQSAAELMLANGVARTTLDDVGWSAAVGRSQLYHYFTDKSALVDAVIEHQTEDVFIGQEPYLSRLDSWGAWDAWRDQFVAHQQQRECLGGCPLGSLASELADTSEAARRALVAAFDRWESRLREGLTAMKNAGLLRDDADPGALATAVLAGLQGGLLLCQLRRNTQPLEISLDAALDRIRSFAN